MYVKSCRIQYSDFESFSSCVCVGMLAQCMPSRECVCVAGCSPKGTCLDLEWLGWEKGSVWERVRVWRLGREGGCGGCAP